MSKLGGTRKWSGNNVVKLCSQISPISAWDNASPNLRNHTSSLGLIFEPKLKSIKWCLLQNLRIGSLKQCGNHRDLIGNWCHVSTTSFYCTLGTDASPNSLGQNFLSTNSIAQLCSGFELWTHPYSSPYCGVNWSQKVYNLIIHLPTTYAKICTRTRLAPEVEDQKQLEDFVYDCWFQHHSWNTIM